MKLRAALLIVLAIAVVPLSIMAMETAAWWIILGAVQSVVLPAGPCIWLLFKARQTWKKGGANER